jgi:Family of unknown function (DUF5709)
MSDQPGRESIEDDLGNSYSLDDENQLQPSDTLDGDVDPVERGYTAPDKLHGSLAFGVTAHEQAQEETIDQRIKQEEEDPDSAYGAPNNESGMDEDPSGMVGGDDPDAIRSDQDFLGSEGGRVGRLVSPDEGMGEDEEKDSVAREGRGYSEDTAEEAAMHYVDGEDVAYREGDSYVDEEQ